MGTRWTLTSVVAAAVVAATATHGHAEPACEGKPLEPLTITCSGTACVADHAPAGNSAVQITSVTAPLGSELLIVYGRAVWELAPGAVVCHWPGLEALRVRRPVGFKAKRAGARDEAFFTVKVLDGKPTPATGHPLHDQFVDVVRAGPGCTGVVVGDRHVLTAAHEPCASAPWVEGASGKRLKVVERIPAPGGMDALLLALGPGASLGLPFRDRSRDFGDEPANGEIKMVGYGATESDGVTGGGERNQNIATVVYWVCDADRARRHRCRRDHEVVILGGGTDTCPGDSGGPILDQVAGGWRLIGITSRWIEAATPCGRGGIYVHVGALATWLDQVLETENAP